MIHNREEHKFLRDVFIFIWHVFMLTQSTKQFHRCVHGFHLLCLLQEDIAHRLLQRYNHANKMVSVLSPSDSFKNNTFPIQISIKFKIYDLSFRVFPLFLMVTNKKQFPTYDVKFTIIYYALSSEIVERVKKFFTHFF